MRPGRRSEELEAAQSDGRLRVSRRAVAIRRHGARADERGEQNGQKSTKGYPIQRLRGLKRGRRARAARAALVVRGARACAAQRTPISVKHGQLEE